MKKEKIIKRIINIIALLTILMFFGAFNVNVQATNYSSKYISIDIPNKYIDLGSGYIEELEFKSYCYYDEEITTYITYGVYDIKGEQTVYTEESLEDYVSEMNENQGTDSSMEVVSKELIEQNGYKGMRIRYTVHYKLSNLKYYCDNYYFSTDKYEVKLFFESTKENFIDSVEEQNIVKSLKIKDTVLKSRGIPFTDVASNSWYHSAAKYNYENNMIKGLNDYTFGPSKNLTRGMLVTILHRMEGSPSVSGASKFTDVQNTKDYYYTAVKWATQNNIISGYNSGKFGPNDPITREQLAVILSKYSKFKGKYKASTVSLSSFKDASKVSGFAETGMQWAVGNGVITGNASSKTLNPQGTTTRAEAASMLYKYCSNVK